MQYSTMISLQYIHTSYSIITLNMREYTTRIYQGHVHDIVVVMCIFYATYVMLVFTMHVCVMLGTAIAFKKLVEDVRYEEPST
jgi:hypothetical protein